MGCKRLLGNNNRCICNSPYGPSDSLGLKGQDMGPLGLKICHTGLPSLKSTSDQTGMGISCKLY